MLKNCVELTDCGKDGKEEPKKLLEEGTVVTDEGKTPKEKKLKSEDKSIVRRKCKKCQQYYTLQDNPGPCYYHPGTWREPYDKSGTLTGWSCCAIEGFVDSGKLLSIINQNALIKDGKGCQTADKHEEDENFKLATGSFPFDSKSAKSTTNDTETPTPTPTPTSTSPKTTKGDIKINEDWILHHVSKTDTLAGLSLHYNIPIADIKRANNLMMVTSSINHLDKIVIPVSKDKVKPKPKIVDTKAEALREFKAKTNASNEESTYYLENSDYDVAAALKEFKADNDWEANTTPGKPISQKV